MNREVLCLYAITDRSYLSGRALSLEEAVGEALKGGVTIVQLREKLLDEGDLRSEALLLQRLCARFHVPLILDDNVRLAVELGCDGVHVGQSDMPAGEARRMIGPGKILGVTAKTVEQAKAAEAAGADYLGSGAMFITSTKPEALPMSGELLRAIAGSVDIPVAAIGGIDITNASQLEGCGIAGIAVSGGIFGKPDIRQAALMLREEAERITGLHG